VNRRSLLSLVAATGACAAFGVSAAEKKKPPVPSWLKASDRPPGLGVYLGAGCTGVGHLGEFEAWLGRKVDQMLEFIGWDVLEQSTAWGVNCWNKAAQAVVYSMPMLPPKAKGTLSDGVNGKFDDLFRKYAAILINSGYADAVIRIGWEFNANWYPWSATKDPQTWAEYWHRIAILLRETPGARFKFDWCPAAFGKGFSPERAYPGDDVVDFIGLDFYNMPIDSKAKTPEQRWKSRFDMHTGLRWHRDFAQSHRKRMSYPEWGTGPHKQYGGAVDDAYFIEQMAAWMTENKVAYHNYWNYKSKDLDTRLSNGSQPNAAAAFIKYFGANEHAHGKLRMSS